MRIAGLAAVLTLAALLLTQHTYSNSRHYEQCRYLYSDHEIQDLLAGEGINVEHDPELNQYPGPGQVLAAAGELKLTEEQGKKIKAIYEQMKQDAVSIGHSIVEQERELEQLISTGGSTDAANLVVREIAEKHQKLRDLHLSAHQQTRAQLTHEQLEQYHQLHLHDAAHRH